MMKTTEALDDQNKGEEVTNNSSAKPMTRAKLASKIFSVAGLVFSVFILALAVVVFVSAILARKEDKPVTLFGYSYSIVVSASMEPEISVGDLLVVRPYNFADVTVGDDIVYQNADPTSPIYGQNVVHRVIEVGDDENGHYLITKGVNNNEADVSPVREENFVGIKAFHSAALGAILLFFTKMENWIILVVIFVCAIIVVQAVRQMVKAVREQRKKGNQPSPKNETHS